jgi:hypothetical protein
MKPELHITTRATLRRDLEGDIFGM